MKLRQLVVLPALMPFVGLAEVHEPKPGSPDRTAIMDAMRVPVSKHVGTRVTFTGNVKISGDWAIFTGNVAPSDGKPPKKDLAGDLDLDFFALLRKVKGEWTVLHWGFAGDISVTEDAKKKFPDAPKELLPDAPK